MNILNNLTFTSQSKFAQIGQDVFVLNVLHDVSAGVFVDIGCQKPFEINNTVILEEKGWKGISVDLMDYSEDWKARQTDFIQADALTCDYTLLFATHRLPPIIDYLSVDLERTGDRYAGLKRVMSVGHRFKVITVEHDLYIEGHNIAEQIPQRNLLSTFGYVLVASNVGDAMNNPMEDWWVHPHLVNAKNYAPFLSHNKTYLEIFEQANIQLEDFYR
ncbi:MAG: hypothetical protein AAGA77_00265 [Bacteroidota bacterium]